MKYFLDTEFMEGPQERTFLGIKIGETKPTIDLISIGIVSEDGREYYAISKDFNLKEAWNRYQIDIQSGDMRNVYPNGKKVYWLRDNVLYPIFEELSKNVFDDYASGKSTGSLSKVISYGCDNFNYSNFKRLLNKYGKTNKEIAEDIIEFCNPTPIDQRVFTNPEFYAYFADYDWVVFCWLFGKMMDLPSGFPMYCKDLKQILDEKVMLFWKLERKRELFLGIDPKYKSIYEAVSAFKTRENYPKQDNSKSHNAIEDARWNKKFYEFLNKL